jgi:hypothetical protein
VLVYKTLSNSAFAVYISENAFCQITHDNHNNCSIGILEISIHLDANADLICPVTCDLLHDSYLEKVSFLVFSYLSCASFI